MERAVFPGQCVLFNASPKARLEIHTSATATAILSDCIPCQRLKNEN